jgi:regulator of PEP synthase PpsR (kinase-PPPase family)
MQRTVFFISDGTAITTETLGHSLLTQFPGIDFRQERIPFVGSPEKAARVTEQINKACAGDGAPAIVLKASRSTCSPISWTHWRVLSG